MGKNYKIISNTVENEKHSIEDNTQPFFSKPFIEEALAILSAGISIFTILSLISYDGLNPEGFPDIDGFTGKAGGYLSFTLFSIFGYCAYLIPAFLFLLSLIIFIGIKEKFLILKISFSIFIILSLCIVLQTIFPEKQILGGHLPGGIVGAWFFSLLYPIFARVGTMVLIVTVVLCLSVPVFHLSFIKLLRLAGKAIGFLFKLIFKFTQKIFEIIVIDKEDSEKISLTSDMNQSCGETEANEESGDFEEDEPYDENDTNLMIKTAKQRKNRRIKSQREIKSDFQLPPLNLLKEPPRDENNLNKEELKNINQKLIETLSSYGISGEVVGIYPGPVVTTYEFRPEKGTKISSITSREDDITMSLEAQKVRIVAPIPGKNAVGFEIPNPTRKMVYLRELLEDPDFSRERKKIPLAIGKDIIGRPYIADLDKMPHLLIAGTTGSGKSVCINAILMGLLYTFTPDELKLILVDPKQVEMQTFADIPHLLLPVVTDPRKAAVALKWAVDEMERRYQLFAGCGARDLQSYNRKIGKKGALKVTEQEQIQNPEDNTVNHDETENTTLPYIIIVIDELADLMMAAVRDVEWAIIRLAQKARAAGIHLIVATQRPSVNVVTGLIKANFPCRIAFRVAAKIDSRVMLDTNGAETLLGDGDMLILPPGTSDLRRIQGAFVSEDEIRSVAEFIRKQKQAIYREEILQNSSLDEESSLTEETETDEYYEKAVALVLSERKASVSYLQRKFSIGYNRAARIMEKMEKEGIVGPQVPGKPYREVIAHMSQSD